jgi:hypothetical protein
MNLKRILNSFFILFLIVSVPWMLVIQSSCKKNKPSYYISQQLKDYCLFQVGSSWVYVNDSTGLKDYAFVSENPYSHLVNALSYIEERIEVPINCSFMSRYDMLHQCNDQNFTEEEAGDRLELWLKHSDTTQGDIFSMWPNQSFNQEQPNPCKCPYNACYYFKTTVIKDFSSGGNIFHDVIHTRYRTADTTVLYPYSFVYDFYFARHIGLIKLVEKSKLHNTYRSFHLVSWNVKQ